MLSGVQMSYQPKYFLSFGLGGKKKVAKIYVPQTAIAFSFFFFILVITIWRYYIRNPLFTSKFYEICYLHMNPLQKGIK